MPVIALLGTKKKTSISLIHKGEGKGGLSWRFTGLFKLQLTKR